MYTFNIFSSVLLAIMDPRDDPDAIAKRQARFSASAGRTTPDRENFAASAAPESGKIQMELQEARALVGRCPTMCSEREAVQREARRELSVFEMVCSWRDLQSL